MELAEEMFHMPVRIGLPQHVKGLAEVVSNEIYATGVGLLIFGSQAGGGHVLPATAAEGSDSLMGRLKRWWTGEF